MKNSNSHNPNSNNHFFVLVEISENPNFNWFLKEFHHPSETAKRSSGKIELTQDVLSIDSLNLFKIISCSVIKFEVIYFTDSAKLDSRNTVSLTDLKCKHLETASTSWFDIILLISLLKLRYSMLTWKSTRFLKLFSVPLTI